MAISVQELFRYLLAIFIFIAFITMVVYFLIGLKSKNYKKAKVFAIIYICSNVLRLLLEYFNLY